MEEALVILACLSNKGCDETYRNYYSRRPALQEFASGIEGAFAKQYAFEYIAPALLAASGQVVSVKLDRSYSASISIKQISISFNKEW